MGCMYCVIGIVSHVVPKATCLVRTGGKHTTSSSSNEVALASSSHALFATATQPASIALASEYTGCLESLISTFEKVEQNTNTTFITFFT